MNEVLRTVPIMDVSRKERKVTRVKLPRRPASLRPLTWWMAGSVPLVAEVSVVFADPGALKPGLSEVEDMALNNQ
jgi:hypothetical protein